MKINVGSAEVKMMCVRLIMMVATTTVQSHLDNLKTYSDHSPPPGWTQNTLDDV